MRLDRLAHRVAGAEVSGDGSVEVETAVHDVRDVAARSLFCCVKGTRFDGHDLAEDAVAKGAVALLVERPLALQTPQIRVDNARAAMGPIAAEVHGNPSRRLQVCGVTGTNGKTTTVALLSAILEAAGMSTLSIGSLSPHEPGRPPNTPEATELQSMLAVAVASGTSAVAMEVSSIGLAQHRVDGTWFTAGVFTNLTQDHLEFHGDMESYYAAKRSLFTEERVGAAVVNSDDPYGARLLSDLEGAPFPVIAYSVDDQHIPIQLPGIYNQSNAQAALAAAIVMGVDRELAIGSLSAVGRIPGRMERVEEGQPFTALVDYAHTPDALANSLQAARELAGRARIILVFGCGGDRDKAKRPLMGRVATELADQAVLTSDNPRSEDPAAIIEQVRQGADERRLQVQPDRGAAIRTAVEAARPGDVVLVAGKGHETGQEVGERLIPFDDREELRAAIRDSAAVGEGAS
ncbi:MAG TPA: UDP-N-acetylmuramoyl-L-alanyl-D-glutamate--2,6-diaminopimelate ligase [Acidimicrobiales bacterium]|nr:UDP-N-acetylmuramoyl-L-alanyl-D-glutamate--2,6-diaminopimelate ligase [Acidimicrobiales bacterium]